MTPESSGSPNTQARIISGLPLPATTGSASPAPRSLSRRISGTGLISLFSGEKPDTIMPAVIASGNGRAAMVAAAAARSSAGSASRRTMASRRMMFFCSEVSISSAGNDILRHARARPGIRVLIPPTLKTWHGRGTSPAIDEIASHPLRDDAEERVRSRKEPSDFDPGNLHK